MKNHDLTNALSTVEIQHIVTNFLFDDDVFLKDLCRHLDIPFERISDTVARKEFFEGDCSHNGARSYIFQMLVFKHMFRLCKIGCQDYLDTYWQQKVLEAVPKANSEPTEEDKASVLQLAKTTKTISIAKLQKQFYWTFGKAARAYEWYQTQSDQQ